jgi:putative ABC transport system permease protein
MLSEPVRHAVRSLRHDWRTTLLAAGLLAVTIGAVMATFAIVDAVLLRPLPVADQDRVVVIWQRDDRRALPIIEVAYGEMLDWAKRSRSFEGLTVIGSVNWSLTLAGAREPQQIAHAAVSPSFFDVVAVRPLLGRGLADAEDVGMQPRAMVISHGLWQRRFGGDPAIVGRATPVKLDADSPPVSIDVVGIMPPDFDFPRGADAWVPAGPLVRAAGVKWSGGAPDGADNAFKWLRVFYAMGRLKPGVRVEDATGELSGVVRTQDRQGGPEPPQRAVIQPIAAYLLGPAGPVLRTLLAGAVLMLLIACANVAGLRVSRAAQHQRALAIRAALGASPRRLAAQVLCESVLLTLAALGAAVAVAWGTLTVLLALAPGNVPRLDEVSLFDWRVLAFGALGAFVTATLCALWPVLVARRVDAVAVLAHGASVASDPRGRRVQRAIVVAQVAVALTLLFGTALFLRTVRGLDRAVLGFDPERLTSIQVSAPTDDPVRWNTFYDALIARVEALPNVTSAAAALVRPLNGPIGWDNQPIFRGQPFEDPATWGLNPHTNFLSVSAGYFETMGIRLVRGRLFTDADLTSSQGVAIVSEAAAKRLWPGKEALGQELREPTYRKQGDLHPKDGWQTVVGVVADVRYRGLNDVRLDLYVPTSQSRNNPQHLMVRTRTDPGDLVSAVRAAVRGIDPNAGVGEAVAMRTIVDAESAPWRFLMRVFVAFAIVAAVLAIVGLGSVIALTVSARARELAIRAALGADARRLRGLVIREAAILTAAGVVLGGLGAIALGRGVAPVLIGVRPDDPWTLVAVGAMAAAAGLLTAWLPARRAARTNAVDALKAE